MQYDNETENLIKQLDKQAKEIQAKIDELKENGNKPKNVRWRASYGEMVYCIDSAGTIIELDNTSYQKYSHYYNIEKFAYSIGNYFKTKEEAEKYKQHLIITQKLKDIALRLNNGVEIDWSNHYMRKYHISLNIPGSKTCKCGLELVSSETRIPQGVVSCLSYKFLEIAIKEIGEKELIEYIKGG